MAQRPVAQSPVVQSPVAQRPYFAYSGAYFCAYLSAPIMVEWGVPEKILQNAVETHWSRSIGPSSQML